MKRPARQPFVWRRALAIAKKEVFHIMRDPYTLALALGMPIFMVVIYGIAIDFNVRNIPLAISDLDESRTSRRLVDTFGSSQYFLVQKNQAPAQTIKDVEAEVAKATLIIPPRFEQDLFASRTAYAQILVDGADNSTVGSVSGYVGAIQNIANLRLADFDPPKPFEIKTRFLFNPELNSRWFVIPGLTVVVMSILSILLTALTVAREWENGSMELLLSTPVQPLEIIIGKLAPYGALGIIAVTFIYVIARLFFGVPFVGNLLVFAMGCLLFLTTYLAQGLLISVTTRRQQVAMQFAMLTGFLPSQLLSGFVFPVASMPQLIRYFTAIFPARWFMQIARDTFLKGSSLFELWLPFCALLIIALGMIYMATSKFKRDLEE